MYFSILFMKCSKDNYASQKQPIFFFSKCFPFFNPEFAQTSKLFDNISAILNVHSHFYLF